MDISPISQVIESPLLSKLLVSSCIAAIFMFLRRKDTEGQSGAFLGAVALLAARDLLMAFYPMPELNYLSDLFFLGFVIFIFLSPYPGTRLTLVLALVLNALVVLLYAGRTIFGLGSAIPQWAFGLLPVADVVLVSVMAFLRRKDLDDGVRQLLSGAWPWAAGFLGAYAILALVLGYPNDVFQRVAVPVSYGWFVAVGLIGIKLQDDQMVTACTYYEESIDSLYNLFLATGTVLKGSFAMEDVIKSMNDALVAETGADGGSIYLVDEFDDLIVAKAYAGVFPPPFALPESLPRKANRVESYMKHAQFPLGETIFGEVAKTGKNIFIPDAGSDPRIVKNGDEDFLRISSFMAVPLMVEDRIIGVAGVAKTTPGESFGEADFDRCKLLSNFGTLAISNFFSFLEANERSGLEQSAGIAAEIQKTIIPKKLPQFPRMAVGAYTQPARGVSGDYYDLIQTRPDRIVGVIGDVAGKGVSAALIMVMIRSILHLITNTSKDISTILNWVNRGITGKIDMDHYATLGIVAINIATGEMEYSNASHQPLLIYRRASDSIEAVEMKSVPIGVERMADYARKTLRLAPGDMAVLYTDGIVEAMNEQGKQFGRKGLSQVVVKHKDLAPKEIVTKIKGELASFTGSVRQHDDQTVLLFKMKA